MVDFTSDKFVINKIKKIFWIDKEKQPIDTKMLFKKFDDNECGIFHGQPSNTYEIKSLFAGFIFFHIKDDTGLFDQSLHGAEDWELWVRIASKYKVATINEFLVNCGCGKAAFGESGLSGNLSRMFKYGLLARKKMFNNNIYSSNNIINYIFYQFHIILAYIKYFKRIVLTKQRQFSSSNKS